MRTFSRALNPSFTKSYWLLILIPIAIVAYFSYLTRNYQPDDALIYLRYIRNVLEGYGLTYNPGENFNGLTSPLNSYLVLIASWVSGNLQAAVISLSGIFMAAACIMGGRLFAKGNFEAIFTASVLGATAYFYSTFGMETTLFLFLIGLSLYLYKIESLWFVVSLALLLITRSEGVFLGALIAGDYLLRNRRLPDFRFLIAAVVIVAGPFIFNYFYYGSIIAATGSAKIGQGQSGLWGTNWIFLDMGYLMPAFLNDSKFAAGMFIGMSLYGFYTEIRNRIAIITLIFGLLLATFYIGLNIPYYHWYYAPFAYLTLIFACHGLGRLLELALHNGVLSRYALIFAIAAGCFGYSIIQSVSFDERGVNEDYASIGTWLKENTPSDSSVAMVEIGIVGWYSERRIIDILGLVNDFNADYIAERNFYGWMLHYQPDYILRHDPIWGHEQSVSLLEDHSAYLPVADFPFEKYVLLRRSPSYTPSAIAELAQRTIEEMASLRELAASTDVGPPMVSVEFGTLFAHAPNTLTLVLDEPVSGLDVSFGLREAAQDLHFGVCFRVEVASSGESLLHHCIEADTPAEDMKVNKSVDVPLAEGEKLGFSIDCLASCDYAWSFWERVLLKE